MFQKLVFFCFFLCLVACTKNEFNQQNTQVPYTVVNAATYPDPSFTSTPGDFQIVTGHGYQGNGVIVFNIDNNIFLAYDLTCPYTDPEACDTPMEVDVLSGEMTCEECGDDEVSFTQFETSLTVEEGGVSETYYLRQYNAILEGNVVRITNF